MADHVIPAESIAPIAENVAERPKFAAAVFTVLFVIFGLCAIALISNPAKHNMSTGEAIGGMSFWLALLFGLRTIFARRAKRALAAAARAKSDPSVTWYLRDLLVVATDGKGIPAPQLSFKIRRAHYDMLTVPPVARVV